MTENQRINSPHSEKKHKCICHSHNGKGIRWIEGSCPCTPPQKQEDEMEKVMKQVAEDIRTGKDNCKACGAAPGTEHKKNCKWLKEQRKQESGGWEKRLRKRFGSFMVVPNTKQKPFSQEHIIEFISTELDKAYKQGVEDSKKGGKRKL